MSLPRHACAYPPQSAGFVQSACAAVATAVERNPSVHCRYSHTSRQIQIPCGKARSPATRPSRNLRSSPTSRTGKACNPTSCPTPRCSQSAASTSSSPGHTVATTRSMPQTETTHCLCPVCCTNCRWNPGQPIPDSRCLPGRSSPRSARSAPSAAPHRGPSSTCPRNQAQSTQPGCSAPRPLHSAPRSRRHECRASDRRHAQDGRCR